MRYNICKVPSKWIETEGLQSKVCILDGFCNIEHSYISANVKKYEHTESGMFSSKTHATHIAGTIVRIAPRSSLFIKQVVIDSSGVISRLEEGLDFAIENEIDVVNLSLSIDHNVNKILQKLRKLHETGCFIVAPVIPGGISFLSNIPEVIAVSSYDCPLNSDVFAPKTIYSCYTDGFGNLSGHSMSTSFVSGICALAKSFDKRMTKAEFLLSLKEGVVK